MSLGQRVSVIFTTPIFRWLLNRVHIGRFSVILPEGKRIERTGSEPGPGATIIVHKPGSMLRRIVGGGGVGFAEAYLEGEWETDDLTAALEAAGRNLDRYVSAGRHNRLIEPVRRLWQRLTAKKDSAIADIDTHYNLGNDFYEAWLDPTMTYSSAIFTNPEQSLDTAQREKYRRLAELAKLGPDDHVLEIGCGWGGFAEYAATEIGCRVTGLTLSTEQADYARKRLAAAGVADRTKIKLLDFRNEHGTYDKIVSIEMIESIPAELWPPLFATIARNLKRGGKVAMQAITIAEDLYASLLRRDDFISKHIFPGGALPAMSTLHDLAAANGLLPAEAEAHAASYAKTLQRWRERFEAAWVTLGASQFDDRFRRTWNYYLAYCEAGFRIGRIDVHQIGFAKT